MMLTFSTVQGIREREKKTKENAAILSVGAVAAVVRKLYPRNEQMHLYNPLRQTPRRVEQDSKDSEN